MIKKLWQDPVWSTVIASLILTIVGSVIAWATGLLPHIISLLLNLWIWVNADTAIANWLLVLLIFPLLVCIAILILVIRHNIQSNSLTTHPWHTYTTDNFFGACYRWQWSNNDPINLLPYCVQCDAVMTQFDTSNYRFSPISQLICESCGYKGVEIEGNRHDLKRRLLIELDRRVRQKFPIDD